MKEYLLNEIKNTMKTWTEPDIYAVSLFVYDEDDNPCKPTVTLGYNTKTFYKESIPDAWDPLEAKWNYAYWLQNEEMIFGVDETAEIVKNWIKENNFPYEDSVDFEDKDYEKYEEITKAFVKVLIEIVKELHESGFIEKTFGIEIPVLIHELEYYDEIAEQNIDANGHELVEDFVRFCMGE